MATMQAWTTDRGAATLIARQVPVPVPGPGELLVRVLACGVCRTDLHVVDEDIPAHRDRVVPGHQVVGDIVEFGSGVTGWAAGDRVGIAWLRRTCGSCRFCRSGRENLCPGAEFTGWDADGGYAEFAVVSAAFAYRLLPDTDPVETAPLLCAGIIGDRALSRANLPPGGTLGIYGFGSSAHIAARLATAGGARVYAMTRGERNQRLARELGLPFVGDSGAVPPAPLDSAIVFAPVGAIMLTALAATVRGGTVVSAGIHMSAIPEFSYDDLLFGERDLRSVTANTRADGDEFLRLARHLAIAPEVTRYRFDEVDRALDDLRAERARGSLVVELG
jgi:propanol-preferring alcohol dehydrogenase